MQIVLNQNKCFVHDCPSCNYLGTLEIPSALKGGDKSMDLYHCEQGGFSHTVIGRFSSDGPDYMSGIGFTQYLVNDLRDRNKLSGEKVSVEDALNEIINNADSVTMYVLSVAVKEALKAGYMKKSDFVKE